MISISNALVLAPAQQQQPLTHARIGYHTYTRELSSATASSVAAGSLVDAPLRPDTFEFWQPTSLPATWQIDLGGYRSIDYVGIAGHTIGTARATIVAETSINGSAWQVLGEVAPATDAAVMLLGSERVARYLRLRIFGNALPRIAVIYAGIALAMPRAIYGGHTPITLSRETVLDHSLSRGGQFLGQSIRRMGLTGSASFRHLPAQWYREQFDPFVRAARRYPYFFAWRPATFPAEVAYVWTDKDIAPSNMGIRDLMDVSWSMQGIGYD